MGQSSIGTRRTAAISKAIATPRRGRIGLAGFGTDGRFCRRRGSARTVAARWADMGLLPANFDGELMPLKGTIVFWDRIFVSRTARSSRRPAVARPQGRAGPCVLRRRRLQSSPGQVCIKMISSMAKETRPPMSRSDEAAIWISGNAMSRPTHITANGRMAGRGAATGGLLIVAHPHRHGYPLYARLSAARVDPRQRHVSFGRHAGGNSQVAHSAGVLANNEIATSTAGILVVMKPEGSMMNPNPAVVILRSVAVAAPLGPRVSSSGGDDSG